MEEYQDWIYDDIGGANGVFFTICCGFDYHVGHPAYTFWGDMVEPAHGLHPSLHNFARAEG